MKMSSSTSSSFLKTSVDDMRLSTDEIIVSSASSSLESEPEWESEVEDEVFLPNDYRFDGSDPMVIPPPIQPVPPSSTAAATATTSGMMALAAAASVASPMSSMGGGGASNGDGGESPLAWPLNLSPATSEASGEGDAAATTAAASGEGDAATTRVEWPVGESVLTTAYGENYPVVVNSAPTIPTATPAARTWPTYKENGKIFAVLVPPVEGSWLWEANRATYTDTGANAGAPTATDAPMSIPPANIFAWPRSSSEDTSIPPAKIFKWSTDAGAPTAGATSYYTPRSPTEIASPSPPPPRGPRFSPISPPDTADSMDGSYAAGMWLSSSVCLSVCLSSTRTCTAVTWLSIYYVVCLSCVPILECNTQLYVCRVCMSICLSSTHNTYMSIFWNLYSLRRC